MDVAAALNATPNDSPAASDPLHSSDPGKRKRDHSDDNPAPPQKTVKLANAHLAINYLARQCNEDLPLISNDDTLPHILQLLFEYQGVLDRHESMACNLGARPLGPILIKRFERLFDGPPKVLKNHGKDGNVVTWLDVVEFARNKPEQFTLGQMSEGSRVCQFYTKQCRVQISEEDYLLISSGMPQKLIPPQPIVEDEEKELGTLEILEKNLNSICHLADQVAARTRQLRHRINGRKQAILERRANEPGKIIRGTSPSLLNGGNSTPTGLHTQGFVSVNARYGADNNSTAHEFSKTGASLSTHNELMSKFFTKNERERRDADRSAALKEDGRRASNVGVTPASVPANARRQSSTGPLSPLRELHPRSEQHNGSIYGQMPAPHAPQAQNDRKQSQTVHTVPSSHDYNSTPGTSAVLLVAPKEKEQEGPYKAEMMARVESFKRGDRVVPPCDRCRRLHMDCIKNLTACQGCTKKHAKCSWREVRESELFGPDGSKVLISAADDSPREREPSVGYRPEERDNVTMQSPQNTTPANGGFDAPVAARAAPEGTALSGSHVGSLNTTPDSDYHNPVHPYAVAQQQHHTYQLPSHGVESHRYDSGRLPSPRTEQRRLSKEERLAHVEQAAATAAAAVNHGDNYSERRDGHQSVVA